jgi:hypothetical protein
MRSSKRCTGSTSISSSNTIRSIPTRHAAIWVAQRARDQTETLPRGRPAPRLTTSGIRLVPQVHSSDECPHARWSGPHRCLGIHVGRPLGSNRGRGPGPSHRGLWYPPPPGRPPRSVKLTRYPTATARGRDCILNRHAFCLLSCSRPTLALLRSSYCRGMRGAQHQSKSNHSLMHPGPIAPALEILLLASPSIQLLR